MQMLEKVHTLADMFLSILVPLSMLVFMTARIVWRLWVWPSQQCRRLAANNAYNTQKTALLSANPIKLIPPKSPILGKHFAAEKRGVTRITLITCFIQANEDLMQHKPMPFSFSASHRNALHVRAHLRLHVWTECAQTGVHLCLANHLLLPVPLQRLPLLLCLHHFQHSLSANNDQVKNLFDMIIYQNASFQSLPTNSAPFVSFCIHRIRIGHWIKPWLTASSADEQLQHFTNAFGKFAL